MSYVYRELVRTLSPALPDLRLLASSALRLQNCAPRYDHCEASLPRMASKSMRPEKRNELQTKRKPTHGRKLMSWIHICTLWAYHKLVKLLDRCAKDPYYCWIFLTQILCCRISELAASVYLGSSDP